MVAAKLELLTARRRTLRSTRDDTLALDKVVLRNRFCKAKKNSNKGGGVRSVTAAIRVRWRSRGGAVPPKSQTLAIPITSLPVLLYIPYGLTDLSCSCSGLACRCPRNRKTLKDLDPQL